MRIRAISSRPLEAAQWSGVPPARVLGCHVGPVLDKETCEIGTTVRGRKHGAESTRPGFSEVLCLILQKGCNALDGIAMLEFEGNPVVGQSDACL